MLLNNWNPSLVEFHLQSNPENVINKKLYTLWYSPEASLTTVYWYWLIQYPAFCSQCYLNRFVFIFLLSRCTIRNIQQKSTSLILYMSLDGWWVVTLLLLLLTWHPKWWQKLLFQYSIKNVDIHDNLYVDSHIHASGKIFSTLSSSLWYQIDINYMCIANINAMLYNKYIHS